MTELALRADPFRALYDGGPAVAAPARVGSFTRVVTATVLLAAAACGGDPEAADAGAEPAGTPPSAASAEPGIPLDPTGADELPPAILGEGGPLMGEPVQYHEGDPTTTGYLAVPRGGGPFPALLIIHEWDGLNDRIRQMADDLAAEGYVTLAVDLYQGRTGSGPDENRALVQEVQSDPPAMLANLNAAVAHLRGRPDVTGRVGAMGWCFGGGVALSFGLDGDNHEATAIFYGSLVDDPQRLAALDHEVYGTFAEMDGGIPPSAVESFAQALEAAGVENDLHVYDDVNHGFWLRIDDDPYARQEPALDAWQRLKAYLERTLGG